MLLGYNTNGLQNHRLDDALRLLADRGFEAVALTPDVGHLDPYRTGPREVAAIAKLLGELGMTVVMETGARYLLDPGSKHEPTLMTADPGARERRFDLYERVARLGADLGAGVLSFWTGMDRAPGPDSRRRLHDGVLRTCEIVRARGLRPSLEPEPGHAVATVGGWRRLRADLGAAGSPALTLDVGHLYVEEDDGDDPVAVTAAAAPFAAQVHLEDMRRGVHEHLEPGDGDVPLTEILSALKKGGYKGPACFELSRSSHRAPAAIDRCRAVWSLTPKGADLS